MNAIDMNSSDAYMCDWKYDTGKGNVITFHSIKAVRVITSSPQRKILSGIIHGKYKKGCLLLQGKPWGQKWFMSSSSMKMVR